MIAEQARGMPGSATRPLRRRARSAPPRPSPWQVESGRSSRPRAVGRPHPGLGKLLAGNYSGVTEERAPYRILVPATASVPLVLKISDTPCRPPAFLHGVHDQYAVMERDGALSYLEVWMAPLGAYQLLGRPVGELGGQVVDLQEVFGAPGRRLMEAVRDAPTWRRRFALLDEFLLGAAEEGRRPSPEVARAWQLVVISGGAAAIGRVANEVGWSHKHLITKFTQQVGLTPKTAARLVRFERVLSRVRMECVTRWDQVAAEGGYADQPHLIRDFRTFTGLTPTDYLHTTRGSTLSECWHLGR
jgi:AraC-like DNA-binding protein